MTVTFTLTFEYSKLNINRGANGINYLDALRCVNVTKAWNQLKILAYVFLDMNTYPINKYSVPGLTGFNMHCCSSPPSQILLL